MRARIKCFGDELWLIIDGNDKTAWAVTEEELIPIRDAINKYLEEK